ncbi:hypothetical protein ACHAWF_014960 [Thalassiosira exigua]
MQQFDGGGSWKCDKGQIWCIPKLQVVDAHSHTVHDH